MRQWAPMGMRTLATQERDEFADLLSGLSNEQWNAPSLCGGDWRVRDVAAHVIGYLDRSRAAFAFALVKHRFHVDRLNAADVKRYSVCRQEEIVDAMRDRAAPRGVGSGFGNRIALVESMIHQQDIRRALNRPRAIPAERLAAALQFTTAAPSFAVAGTPAESGWLPLMWNGQADAVPKFVASAKRCS